MRREEIIEWMDAWAPLWKGADHNTQAAIDAVWFDLLKYLKAVCLDGCPMMLANRKTRNV